MTEKISMPRRQIVLLAGLLVILAAAVIWGLMPALSGSGSGEPPVQAAGAAATRKPATQPMVDVKLERLEAAGIDPAGGGRNPFRMGAAAPAGSGSGDPAPVKPAPVVVPPVTGPPPPPPIPPIPFRFIGILTGPPGVGKIAVLTDGKIVLHGKEGAEIEGRYRIVKIGEESIQMEHTDGQGRQTIRLSSTP